jgi:hypothetical protein
MLAVSEIEESIHLSATARSGILLPKEALIGVIVADIMEPPPVRQSTVYGALAVVKAYMYGNL